jgi:NADPH-dependent 2,4-dienoyl-CoA reductase/sulfur reductase-like enzyme
VIGGSFIGAETAASLRARGLDVTIVEMGETLMPQLRCGDLSAELVELYRSEGVDVLLETQLEELTGNGRLLTGARTADGRTLEGFLAIVGVGVVPNVELAQDAGAEVDDGVVVDERFRTSLEDVYAVGDVARYPDPTSGRLRRIEHWSNADAQGAHLGRQLAGARAAYDELPVFFTQLFGRKLQVLGDVEPAATCVLRGSLADGRLVGFHLTEEGRLVGAVVHGESADVVAELGALIRERPVVDDPTRLSDDNLRPADAVAA